MGGGGQKMKIFALGPNSSKFYIHNQWATRRLKMQKLTTQNGQREGRQLVLNIREGPGMVKSFGWPHQLIL